MEWSPWPVSVSQGLLRCLMIDSTCCAILLLMIMYIELVDLVKGMATQHPPPPPRNRSQSQAVRTQPGSPVLQSFWRSARQNVVWLSVIIRSLSYLYADQLMLDIYMRTCPRCIALESRVLQMRGCGAHRVRKQVEHPYVPQIKQQAVCTGTTTSMCNLQV